MTENFSVATNTAQRTRRCRPLAIMVAAEVMKIRSCDSHLRVVLKH